MNHEWKQRIQNAGRKIGALLVASSLAGASVSYGGQQAKGGKDTASTDTKGQFYCNVKALTTEERARHRELGAKMGVARTATVETEKGYEFQYNPEKLSVGEVAEWVMAESKCCPFFDFHIDLEESGKLICLRLTGSEGVKAFIRAEIHM